MNRVTGWNSIGCWGAAWSCTPCTNGSAAPFPVGGRSPARLATGCRLGRVFDRTSSRDQSARGDRSRWCRIVARCRPSIWAALSSSARTVRAGPAHRPVPGRRRSTSGWPRHVVGDASRGFRERSRWSISRRFVATESMSWSPAARLLAARTRRLQVTLSARAERSGRPVTVMSCGLPGRNGPLSALVDDPPRAGERKDE